VFGVGRGGGICKKFIGWVVRLIVVMDWGKRGNLWNRRVILEQKNVGNLRFFPCKIGKNRGRIGVDKE
jgi:hypothetical protein